MVEVLSAFLKQKTCRQIALIVHEQEDFSKYPSASHFFAARDERRNNNKHSKKNRKGVETDERDQSSLMSSSSAAGEEMVGLWDADQLQEYERRKALAADCINAIHVTIRRLAAQSSSASAHQSFSSSPSSSSSASSSSSKKSSSSSTSRRNRNRNRRSSSSSDSDSSGGDDRDPILIFPSIEHFIGGGIGGVGGGDGGGNEDVESLLLLSRPRWLLICLKEDTTEAQLRELAVRVMVNPSSHYDMRVICYCHKALLGRMPQIYKLLLCGSGSGSGSGGIGVEGYGGVSENRSSGSSGSSTSSMCSTSMCFTKTTMRYFDFENGVVLSKTLEDIPDYLRRGGGRGDDDDDHYGDNHYDTADDNDEEDEYADEIDGDGNGNGWKNGVSSSSSRMIIIEKNKNTTTKTKNNNKKKVKTEKKKKEKTSYAALEALQLDTFNSLVSTIVYKEIYGSGSRFMRVMRDAIKYSLSVTRVDLTNSGGGDAIGFHLMSVLSTNRYVTELILDQCSLTDIGLAHLCSGLVMASANKTKNHQSSQNNIKKGHTDTSHTNTSLLGGGGGGDGRGGGGGQGQGERLGLGFLSSSSSSSSTSTSGFSVVTTLSLARNPGIDDNGLRVLALYLSSPHCRLKHLNMSRNNSVYSKSSAWSADAVGLFFQALGQNTSLVTVDLSKCGLTEAAGLLMARYWLAPQAAVGRRVGLPSTAMSTAASVGVASEATHMALTSAGSSSSTTTTSSPTSSLRHLNLSNNIFRDIALTAILSNLPRTVTRLFIANTGMSAFGFRSLSVLLSKIPTQECNIEVLDAHGNDMLSEPPTIDGRIDGPTQLSMPLMLPMLLTPKIHDNKNKNHHHQNVVSQHQHQQHQNQQLLISTEYWHNNPEMRGSLGKGGGNEARKGGGEGSGEEADGDDYDDEPVALSASEPTTLRLAASSPAGGPVVEQLLDSLRAASRTLRHLNLAVCSADDVFVAGLCDLLISGTLPLSSLDISCNVHTTEMGCAHKLKEYLSGGFYNQNADNNANADNANSGYSGGNGGGNNNNQQSDQNMMMMNKEVDEKVNSFANSSPFLTPRRRMEEETTKGKKDDETLLSSESESQQKHRDDNNNYESTSSPSSSSSSSSSLSALSVAGNAATMGERVILSLVRNTHLESLDVSDMCLTDGMCVPLGDVYHRKSGSHPKNKKKIILRHHQHLHPSPFPHQLPLRSLTISRNPLHADAVRSIVSFARMGQTLEHVALVDVWHDFVDEAGRLTSLSRTRGGGMHYLGPLIELIKEGEGYIGGEGDDDNGGGGHHRTGDFGGHQTWSGGRGGGGSQLRRLDLTHNDITPDVAEAFHQAMLEGDSLRRTATTVATRHPRSLSATTTSCSRRSNNSTLSSSSSTSRYFFESLILDDNEKLLHYVDRISVRRNPTSAITTAKNKTAVLNAARMTDNAAAGDGCYDESTAVDEGTAARTSAEAAASVPEVSEGAGVVEGRTTRRRVREVVDSQRHNAKSSSFVSLTSLGGDFAQIRQQRSRLQAVVGSSANGNGNNDKSKLLSTAALSSISSASSGGHHPIIVGSDHHCPPRYFPVTHLQFLKEREAEAQQQQLTAVMMAEEGEELKTTMEQTKTRKIFIKEEAEQQGHGYMLDSESRSGKSRVNLSQVAASQHEKHGQTTDTQSGGHYSLSSDHNSSTYLTNPRIRLRQPPEQWDGLNTFSVGSGPPVALDTSVN